ncbi:GntR family transcriptional regulator [Allobranchiibius sp. CTAmp26]|uniref:GntR family transcriptional regulator n=1 Tax=Allobranchiibius sp. CTAmp26 TaxID=2815214 RepID=UPI001AA16F80|nr:GntR family transcriptional regulator [Allobranchiibius sp. CTAmp26]MBO1755511.1 GntR family transcriptional regulator [Allobranchiibius sp. CTAmp26]
MGDSGGRTVGGRHQSLQEQVLAELRRLIIGGYYSPGERLTEERLAEDFGVSRNPVREALRVAASEGFVRLVARHGAYVESPDASAIEDLFAVRERLEPLAARLAATRISAEDISELRAMVEEARRASAHEDYAHLAELNSAFHLRVIKISGNRWLVSMVSSLYWHVQWVYRQGAASRAPHSWSEHAEFVDALESRDADRAEKAALVHVLAASEAAVDLLNDAEANPQRPQA